MWESSIYLPAYPRHMTPDADHFVSYTTPRGSVVTLPGLTEEQRDAAVATLTTEPVEAPQTAAETTQCGKCGGQGYWMERRETKTATGGTVVTYVRVNCRPCGGSGQVPKK